MSAELEQVVVTGSSESLGDAVSHAVSAITNEGWTIAWLTLGGMAVGMATVGFVRIFLPNVDGETPEVWAARSAFLKRLGAGSSLVWTVVVQAVYIRVALDMSWVIGVVAGVGPALVAGATNGLVFDKVVGPVWGWALSKLPKKDG